MPSCNPVKALNAGDRDKCRGHQAPLPLRRHEAPVVDLFELRCAVAVLAHADHNIDDHTTVDLLRLGSAIRHISRLRRQMHGPFTAHTDALLSDDAYPAGRRTMNAIEQLATLAQITESIVGPR